MKVDTKSPTQILNESSFLRLLWIDIRLTTPVCWWDCGRGNACDTRSRAHPCLCVDTVWYRKKTPSSFSPVSYEIYSRVVQDMGSHKDYSVCENENIMALAGVELSMYLLEKDKDGKVVNSKKSD